MYNKHYNSAIPLLSASGFKQNIHYARADRVLPFEIKKQAEMSHYHPKRLHFSEFHIYQTIRANHLSPS
jgi:hypothetical protein